MILPRASTHLNPALVVVLHMTTPLSGLSRCYSLHTSWSRLFTGTVNFYLLLGIHLCHGMFYCVVCCPSVCVCVCVFLLLFILSRRASTSSFMWYCDIFLSLSIKKIPRADENEFLNDRPTNRALTRLQFLGCMAVFTELLDRPLYWLLRYTLCPQNVHLFIFRITLSQIYRFKKFLVW